jgi:hypothetical protein
MEDDLEDPGGMNWKPAESIRRVGFRKWYERQLLSSHAHMVLGFLSAVALVGCVEAYRTSVADAGLYALYVVLCGGIGAWAMRRYSFLMLRAEDTANQANCPDCGDYGRFKIVRSRASEPELDVRCRKCTREWIITGLR